MLINKKNRFKKEIEIYRYAKIQDHNQIILNFKNYLNK